MDQSILINKDKDKETIKSSIRDSNILKKALATPVKVPAGYVGITYPTKGKLAIPEKLHFRDYSLADIGKLTARVDKTKTVIDILNDLVLEEIDCGDMHPAELLYTRLMIFKGFYGPKLKNVNVYIDDTLTGKELTASSNITEVTINIDKLTCNSLPKEVTNNITLERDDISYTFRFPKQKDILVVDTYIKLKYADKETKFASIKMLASAHQGNPDKILQEVDPEDYLDFTEYIQEKELDRLQMLRTCQLKKWNDLEFSDDQLTDKAQIRVPYSVWDDVAQIQESFNFGMVDSTKVNIYSEGVTLKNQERRFSFRHYNLIPEKPQQRGSKGISFNFS